MVGKSRWNWKENFDYVGKARCGFVRVRKDNKWGYVNVFGEIQIPLRYDYASDFREIYDCVNDVFRCQAGVWCDGFHGCIAGNGTITWFANDGKSKPLCSSEGGDGEQK